MCCLAWNTYRSQNHYRILVTHVEEGTNGCITNECWKEFNKRGPSRTQPNHLLHIFFCPTYDFSFFLEVTYCLEVSYCHIICICLHRNNIACMTYRYGMISLQNFTGLAPLFHDPSPDQKWKKFFQSCQVVFHSQATILKKVVLK